MRSFVVFVRYILPPNYITFAIPKKKWPPGALIVLPLCDDWWQNTNNWPPEVGWNACELTGFLTVVCRLYRLAGWHVYRWYAIYRQLNDLPSFTRLEKGPISESDFFSWEALICGPKDTPFVRRPFCDDKPSTQDSDAPRKAAFSRPNWPLYVVSGLRPPDGRSWPGYS